MTTPFRLLYYLLFCNLVFSICSCKHDKGDTTGSEFLNIVSARLDQRTPALNYRDVGPNPVIRLSFSEPVDRSSAAATITLHPANSTSIPVALNFENNDSTIIVASQNPLLYLTKYTLTVFDQLLSKSGKRLTATSVMTLVTSIDPANKFPLISDTALVQLVQQQHFKYFWDFGHPVSGLARERNTSGETVTAGGSGFGVMAIITGVHRGFVTRAQGFARMQTIVGFLKNTAQTFHGAFPHWLNGTTGVVIPFSQKDNGADLVETSYLIQGLLCARQYFNGADPAETALRADINTIWQNVQWNWFRKNNENVLYWHWSPNFNWDMNVQIKGWNECLITYVLAAASPSYSIPAIVYHNGWASNGGIKNLNTYYGYQLPLGQPYGGPLFFAHYSFLGINPDQLTDTYANYFTQNKNHTLINYTHCVTNPGGYYGYSDSCWGLTASDDINGYKAHSPTNDDGVISPTAALSSFPYTPQQSMKALRFFYYKLGDKLWGSYGFYDAFSLHEPWFTNSTLAIDQGPIIVMMENYRSGLLWNLFMSCPEVKTGMLALGFSSPHL
jgi:hypothetical protein